MRILYAFNSTRQRTCVCGAAPMALKVDPASALNRWPQLWRIDPHCWEERLAVLRDLDVDVAKVVTSNPSVLGFPAEGLRAKAQAGLDVDFEIWNQLF